jgi:uncharacterized protein (DUF433 family)
MNEIRRGIEKRLKTMQEGYDEALASRRVVKQRNLLGAAPVFQGTRIPLATVWEFFDLGAPDEDILLAYPSLTPAHIEKARLMRSLAQRVKAGASLGDLATEYPDLSEDEIKSIKQLTSAA